MQNPERSPCAGVLNSGHERFSTRILSSCVMVREVGA